MSLLSEEEEDNFFLDPDDDNSADDASMVETTEEDCLHSKKNIPYTVLTEETIKKLQQNDISQVSNLLSISTSIACTLLLHKSWKLTSVLEEWFADEHKLRNAIGISQNEILSSQNNNNYCKICMDNVENLGTMLSAACGHLFCFDCWKAHVSISINDGPGCLMLRCPEPECKAYADLDLVDAVTSADDNQIYYKYLLRSYVELSNNRKWCPAPGCDFAVEFDVGGSDCYDVCCDCKHSFCWNCREEAHRPVGCATVTRWVGMHTSDAYNATWMAAYTKPCPKCKRNIERISGCEHMFCPPPCEYHFCWLCLAKWLSYDHIATCNKYVAGDNGKREASINEMRRYRHYFDRWSSNQKSIGIAAGDLERARDVHVPLLQGKLQEGLKLDLQFVVEAWEQIVECRRVMKWSYAYGYFIEEWEVEKRTLFECLQGEAGVALEKLHDCAENELKKYVEGEGGLDGFFEFCRKLRTLTSVTRKFFESLVGAFEGDLCEVERLVVPSPRPCKKGKVGGGIALLS